MVKNVIPSEGEIVILQILWQKKTASVKEVFQEVRKIKPTGYTTTLKLMQIMLSKQFVTRTTVSNKHIYRPAITQASLEKTLIKQLLRTHFQQDAIVMLEALLSHKILTKTALTKFVEKL